MKKYSVLMSVYCKETARNLETAVKSMLEQTVSPDELVLVCDGLLTDELNSVIHKLDEKSPDTLKVVRLSENIGLGRALQTGLKYASNELVARMDSDDISCPDRCEKQLLFMQKHPDISILGGTIAEFDDDPEKITAVRSAPESQEAILAFSRSRNPFNHVTVMYRKKDVLEAGGYLHMPYLEDYYLWIRMLMHGCRGHNLKDVLVNVRVGNGMTARRSGLHYARAQEKLFSYMLRNRYINRAEYMKAVITRTAVSLFPDKIRQLVYRYCLRSSS